MNSMDFAVRILFTFARRSGALSFLTALVTLDLFAMLGSLNRVLPVAKCTRHHSGRTPRPGSRMNSRRAINPGTSTMLCRTIFLALSTAASLWSVAQPVAGGANVPFDKVHFPDGAVLKQALSAIKKGDDLANKGGLDQDEATAQYAQALRINPDNAELNFKIGVCLLNGGQPPKALSYMQRAMQFDPFLPRIHYLVA